MGAIKTLLTDAKTFYSREEIRSLLTPEYIRGLFEGEGTFSNDRRSDGTFGLVLGGAFVRAYSTQAAAESAYRVSFGCAG